MKEVRLEIDADGIVQNCLSTSSKHTIDSDITDNNKIRYFAVLQDILKKNLKIESDACNEEERRDILDIVKKSIYQYFIYNIYGVAAMTNLHCALNSRSIQLLKSASTSLINGIIEPNSFIYSPARGINRKNGNNKTQKNIDSFTRIPDLSTRACTLDIGGANFLGLKSLLRFTSESLDRESFSYVAGILDTVSMDILKKYALDKTCYTLDELYVLHKDSIPLVDYGLKIICEKYHEIEELVLLVREIEGILNRPQEIVKKEICRVLSLEDLPILTSIRDNIEKIAHEKRMHNCMIKLIEYMANETTLLVCADEKKVLKIDTSFESFYEDYVANTRLEKVIHIYKVELEEEIKRRTDALNLEAREYIEKKTSLRKWKEAAVCDSPEHAQTEKEMEEEMEKAKCSIARLEKEIYSLKCEIKKEDLQLYNIRELFDSLYFLSATSPGQKQYMFEKIEEFAKVLYVKVVKVPEDVEEAAEERKLFFSEFIRENIIKILILSIVFIKLTALLIISARNEIKPANIN
ncbi:hypothetical protein NEMIN01_2255 [Nematocida minor]|uniref:uncharacterized protein n=1 Tax=Nematocida minor TaxID=1912983 RepID=UPI00221FD798|nr:uncharacterized protein NEMIN01_2255 [Nematocida minor]KAI5192869.1 hypothetical protein NEMIN01_2255 [Nematocida minor]